MKTLLEKLSHIPNFTLMEGKVFLQRKSNQFDTSIPLVVYNLRDSDAVYKKIFDIFGQREIEEYDSYIIVKELPLFDKTKFTFGDLMEIIARLRDEDGCPWDREQTPLTIRKNIIEESYELVEAIDLGDNEKICEESGDVILQGAFTAAMCEESGSFTISDALSGLCHKLISRHTHIFGKDKAISGEDALYYWERAKAKEKNQKDIKSKLDSVPQNFNALMKANKVQKYIKKTGFDHPTVAEAIDKIYEEIAEFVSSTGLDKEKEAGDMLFSVVNVLRMSDIDPEVALNGTTNRFIKRFMYIADKAAERGEAVENMPLSEMEKLYNEAKVLEKNDNL